jgi:hypothetical protein
MAFKLQREDGEIKEYPTVYGDGYNGIDPNPRRYVTKCGQEWILDPGIRGGCNHLDCAIHMAENESRSSFMASVAFIIFPIGLILFMRDDPNFMLSAIISGGSAFAGFVILIHGFRTSRQLKELVEFREEGAIGGIKAHQIFEDIPFTKPDN